MELTINNALKEWAIAINALETGNTIMLLRKGGILEKGGCYRVAQSRLLQSSYSSYTWFKT